MGRTKTPAERFATMPADKHGVRSGYTYWGCRCDACTRADLAYRRPTTERGPIPDTAHATRAGYRYWGCRCDACTLANRTAARQRRDARRGPAPEGPTVTRRYQYRIDTTPAVRAALVRVFGWCRFIHNAYIAMARDAFAGGNAHPTLGEATKAFITQGRANPDTPWLKELPTIALRGALKDAVQAYENFFSSVTRTRQGRSVGRPVFQRRHARQTARFYEAGFRIRGGWQNTKRGGGRLYLSKVGTVSVNWHRPLPSHPSSVTIIKAADGTWWASFVVSVPVPTPIAPTQPDRVAGIDLGLADLATIAYSDGTREKIAAPKRYRAAERKLARAQKKLSRAQRGSKNREKLRVEVARIHARTANLRRDHARQLISRLIRENQTISLETLSVSAMVRGRYGKSITDAGWSQFVTELEAKAEIHGRTVVRADRFFPSTRLCAICNTKSGPSSIDVRQWTCPCGIHPDRDYNAATNLMVLALAPGKVERINACGRDIRLRLAGAVSNEAGTRRNEVTS